MIQWLKRAVNFSVSPPLQWPLPQVTNNCGVAVVLTGMTTEITPFPLWATLPGYASDSLMLMPDLYSTPTEHKSIGEQGSRQHLSASGFDVGFSSFCILFFCPFLLYPRHQNLYGLLEKWHLRSGAPLSGGTEDTYRWYTMNIQCFNIIRFLFKCVRK